MLLNAIQHGQVVVAGLHSPDLISVFGGEGESGVHTAAHVNENGAVTFKDDDVAYVIMIVAFFIMTALCGTEPAARPQKSNLKRRQDIHILRLEIFFCLHSFCVGQRRQLLVQAAAGGQNGCLIQISCQGSGKAAKILITGSLFKSGSKNFVIAKIIGTETSRVLGASASGTEDFTSLVPMLAPKVSAILEKQSAKLLPKEQNKEDVLSRLKKVVQGKQRKVFVKVKEDIAVSVPDPAAETELKKLLLALDFQVVNTRNEADYAVIGEAIAANAGNYHQFTSASARLELSIFNKDKKLLATGAARETLAGGTYIIAAKEAIARTALKLAGEFFPVMK